MLNPVKFIKRQINKNMSLDNAGFVKLFLNFYPPYLGAGVKVEKIDYQNGVIQVSMPLTWYNKNVVGTQFGGSLYSMTDPFFMTLLMQRLGHEYMVWDKSACIDFVKAGTGTVYAKFSIDNDEVAVIKQLAKEGQAVFRNYELNITDASGNTIAHVKKTVYIRLRAFSRSKDFKSRV